MTPAEAVVARAHVEALLDEALRETFPASDPVSVFVPVAAGAVDTPP